MIFEVIKKFKINQQTTPMFLLGRSFGGLIATNMAASPVGKAMFKGVCVITPFYRCWTEKLYNVYPALSVLNYVKPHHVFESEF
jgi:alpha-beta hydrolase superfamily lysophospholipase